jgi:nucleotide-binding universal stress UspA family protein
MERDFDEVEQDLRTEVAQELSGREERWAFQRRQGLITEQLLAAARELQDAHPDGTVAVVVGSSAQAMHRMIGSVAVSLARHTRVPVVIVP